MLGEYQLDQAQRNLAGYAIFGAISPSDAWKQASSGETGADFSPGGWAYAQTGVPQLLSTGQIDAQAWSPNCASMPAPNVNLFQTVSGLALGTTSAGVGILAANPALLPMISVPVAGAIIAGAAVVVGIISTILNHHRAAVRQEQQLGCAAIAAANNAFNLIDQAVRSGQLRPADAAAAMDALVSKVSAFVAPAVKHNPCNANCELLVQVKAVAIYRKSLYADLAAAQATAPAPAPAPVVVSSGGQPIPTTGLVRSADGQPGLAIPPGGYPPGFVPTCGSNRPSGIWINAPIGSCEWALQQTATTGPVMPVTSSAGPPAQPGAGSTGSGPSPAPAVTSGSVLVLPKPGTTAPTTPAWVWLAAAGVALFAVGRIF
jgi:hypothetical protein